MSVPSTGFCGEAFLRLCRSLPRSPNEDTLHTVLEMARLQLRSTALLPTHGAHGLGQGQQATVEAAIDAATASVGRAVQTPRTHLSLAHISLLRGLARGSAAWEAEHEFMPRGHCLPHKFRTHRHAPFVVLKEFADGLALVELSYEVLLEGQRRLRSLATPAFFEGLDDGLHWASMCNVAWALPVLFDGVRLHCGLAVAAACAAAKAPAVDDTESTESSAEAKSDPAAAAVLGDAECAAGRERVLNGALFFLAASHEALLHYTPPVPSKHCSQGAGPPDDSPLHHWRNLEADIRLGLERCREESERRAPQPGRALRVVLECFSELLELGVTCPGVRTLLRLAFAYPCLVPSGLQPLHDYDGGLLSVWDACLHLLELHAKLHSEVLPLHALVCAVLGGVVGNLSAPAELAGPFVLHRDSDVALRVAKLRAAWPTASTPRSGRAIAAGCGKRVGANAVLCEALATGQYRGQQRASSQSVARADAALTMRVLSDGLGVQTGHTTEGVAPLRRLYIAAFHYEPGMPEGPVVSAPSGTTFEGSPLCTPSTACSAPCSVPVEQIDTVWRDITGAAAMCAGPLYCFTRRALADSLETDWAPAEAVKQALRDRELAAPGRGAPVMTPATAVAHVAVRAQEHVAASVGAVDAVVLSTDGPRNVTRSIETLAVLSRAAYCAVSGGVWEGVLVACCPSQKRKQR